MSIDCRYALKLNKTKANSGKMLCERWLMNLKTVVCDASLATPELAYAYACRSDFGFTRLLMGCKVEELRARPTSPASDQPVGLTPWRSAEVGREKTAGLAYVARPGLFTRGGSRIAGAVAHPCASVVTVPQERTLKMASDKLPERDPFLAAIEAKIAAWTAVAESYRAARALDTGLADGAHGSFSTQGATKPTELPVGVFRDKGVKEAIVIYLEACRRKQTNKEIANGLIAGGIATTASNFEATVATALVRLRREGTILRFPDGWDLASSYPENLRARLQKDASPKRAKESELASDPVRGRPRPQAPPEAGGAVDEA